MSHYRSGRWPVRITLGVSAVLFAWACFTPAFEQGHGPGFFPYNGTAEERRLVPGYEALAWGWAGSNTFVTWLGNPLWLAGVLLLGLRRPASAAVCGCLCTVIGLEFLQSPGEYYGPREPRMGAYLWVGSFIAFALGSAFVALTTRWANRDDASLKRLSSQHNLPGPNSPAG